METEGLEAVAADPVTLFFVQGNHALTTVCLDRSHQESSAVTHHVHVVRRIIERPVQLEP